MALPTATAAGATPSGPSALFALGVLTVVGGTPTVANTRSISVVGAAGNDVITIDEVNGALPSANLIGGTGDDTLVGGSGDDILVGRDGNDVLLGKGGTDFLFGGAGNHSLTGGDGNDQVFGEAGNDRLGTDLTDITTDLAGIPGTGVDDGSADNVIVNTTNGDDVLIGGPGIDTLDGGAGDDTLIEGEIVTDGLVAGQSWLAAHTRVVEGKSVLDVNQQSYTVPAADLAVTAPDPTS